MHLGEARAGMPLVIVPLIPLLTGGQLPVADDRFRIAALPVGTTLARGTGVASGTTGVVR